MATFYSSLYKAAPNAQSDQPPVYRGPDGHQRTGTVHTVRGTFDNKAGAGAFGANAGDVLKLCKVPPGARLLRFVAVPSADMDAAQTFTFNLGFSSLSNAFVSGSAALQGTTAFELSVAQTIAGPVAVANDELLLTRAAGSLGTAGTLTFVAEFGY